MRLKELNVKNARLSCIVCRVKKGLTKSIINNLAFGKIRERHRAVFEASQGTYAWAVDHDFSGLGTWLSAQNGIYWIAGKAG
jgi:hypothetical protein